MAFFHAMKTSTIFKNIAGAPILGPNTNVSDLITQPDGKLLVLSSSITFGAYQGLRFARLNSDYTLDKAFCDNASQPAKFGSIVEAAAVQSDGKILVAGFFTSYAGTTGRSYLIRLNSDGTLDTAFCVNAVDGSKFSSNVVNITVQSDGKILVGGNFLNYAATAGRSYLIRLNSDGTTDTAFCTNASDGSKFNNTASSINVNTSGKILVGGVFTSYAGVSGRNRFIRLNSDGTTDTAFCANAVDGTKFNSSVDMVVIAPNDRLILGGAFSAYDGVVGRSRLIALQNDGTLDTAFCVTASDETKFSVAPNSLAIGKGIHSNRLFIGGSFTGYISHRSKRPISSIFATLNISGTIR